MLDFERCCYSISSYCDSDSITISLQCEQTNKVFKCVVDKSMVKGGHFLISWCDSKQAASASAHICLASRHIFKPRPTSFPSIPPYSIVFKIYFHPVLNIVHLLKIRQFWMNLSGVSRHWLCDRWYQQQRMKGLYQGHPSRASLTPIQFICSALLLF